ncbi:hypothetical protein ACHAWF_005871 [Thalassiosira exigua]
MMQLQLCLGSIELLAFTWITYTCAMKMGENDDDTEVGGDRAGGTDDGEGIEYELTDFLLLSDIEETQSWGFLSDSEGSKASNINDATAMAGDITRISAYDNFDDLFLGGNESESDEDNSIRDSWIVGSVDNNSGNSLGGSGRVSLGCSTSKSGTQNYPSLGYNAIDMDCNGGASKASEAEGNDANYPNVALVRSSEDAQILKNIIVQCLARNNKEKTRGHISIDRGSSIASETQRKPESTNGISRYPSDPSKGVERNVDPLREDGAIFHSSHMPMQPCDYGDNRNENEAAARSIPRDPPKRDPPEEYAGSKLPKRQWQAQQIFPQIVGTSFQTGMAISQVNWQQPPRPDIIRYSIHKPLPSVGMRQQQKWILHRRQRPPRPEMLRYSNITDSRRAPSLSFVSTPYLTKSFTSNPESVVRSLSHLSSRDMNQHHRSDLHGHVQGLSEQSILRRRRYKEMLLKQCQNAKSEG